jgi:quaternary ammonium compound-resistance protein SugE
MMATSLYLLALAARGLPIGTAYAVWTGIGAVGTATLGIILFDEPATIGRIVCMLMVVGGIAGLKIFSG